MLTSRVLFAPHLPTLLVDEHRGHRTPMLEALSRASERFLADSPQALVVVSARWEAPGPFLVDAGRRHATLTDYSGFGVEVRYDCAGHPRLARALVENGRRAKVRVGSASRGVDSGVTVPLHFLVPARNLPVVPLSVGRRPHAECKAWGEVVRSTLAAWPERVGFVVGGLLSYNEHAWNLGREVPETHEFDRRTLEALERGEWTGMEEADEKLIEKARPESGLRHLEILGGFVAADARGQVVCYESGPGVGAALVEFPSMESAEATRTVDRAGRKP